MNHYDASPTSRIFFSLPRLTLRLPFFTLITLAGTMSATCPTRTAAQGAHAPPSAAFTSPVATLLQQAGYTALPLAHFKHDYYSLRGMVNATPTILVLGSGFAGNIALSPRVATTAGLHSASKRPLSGVGDSTVADTGRLTRFTLGALPLGAQAVTIQPGIPFPGLIGAQFLRAHHAVIDYVHDVLYLRDVPTKPTDDALATGLQHQGYRVVPLGCQGTPGRNVLQSSCLVQAAVDSTPLPLLLDTSLPQEIVIDQPRADALGWPTASKDTSSGAGTPAVPHGGVPHLTMGPLPLDSLQVVTQDLTNLRQAPRADGGPVAVGVLGSGVLHKYGALVDFGHGLVYLHDSPTAALMSDIPLLPDLVTVVPFQQNGDGQINVVAEVDGRHGTFVLDTGSPLIVLNVMYWRPNPTGNPDTAAAGSGAEGEVTARTLRIGTFLQQLDPHDVGAPRPWKPSNTNSIVMSWDALGSRFGTLGLPAMEPFETIIDYAHQRLIVIRLDSAGRRLAAVPAFTPRTTHRLVHVELGEQKEEGEGWGLVAQGDTTMIDTGALYSDDDLFGPTNLMQEGGAVGFNLRTRQLIRYQHPQ